METVRCSYLGLPQSHGMCLESLQNHSCIMRAGSIEVRPSSVTAIICNLFRIIPESQLHHAGRQHCYTKRCKRKAQLRGTNKSETMSNNAVPIHSNRCLLPMPSCILVVHYNMLCCSPLCCLLTVQCVVAGWPAP